VGIGTAKGTVHGISESNCGVRLGKRSVQHGKRDVVNPFEIKGKIFYYIMRSGGEKRGVNTTLVPGGEDNSEKYTIVGTARYRFRRAMRAPNRFHLNIIRNRREKVSHDGDSLVSKGY